MRLDQALALSVLLHGLLLLVRPSAGAPAPAGPLRVTLAPPAVTPLSQVALTLPADDPPAEPTPLASGSPLRPEPPARPPRAQRPPDAAIHTAPPAPPSLNEQLAHELLYPAAAIAQGLEGETLVLLIFGADGRVRSASIEQGSGHALLDQAALRAARRLRAPPAGAAEILLPVRFRLLD